MQNAWKNTAVCLVKGYEHDTRIETGEEYETVALGEVFDLAVGDKACAPAAIFSTYHECDAREGSVQKIKGSYVALVLDIDEGSHHSLDVVSAVKGGAASDHAFDLAARGRNALPTPADEKQSGNGAAYSNGPHWSGATNPTEITTEDVCWSKADLGLMTTHQPILVVTADDEFRILMGDLSDVELARRVKLRERRNVASKMLADTQSAIARQLCWMMVEAVTPHLYAPASLEWLDELILFTRRLLIIANQAHLKLDGGDYD